MENQSKDHLFADTFHSKRGFNATQTCNGTGSEVRFDEISFYWQCFRIYLAVFLLCAVITFLVDGF